MPAVQALLERTRAGMLISTAIALAAAHASVLGARYSFAFSVSCM